MGKRPPKWLPGERVEETILMQRKSVEQLRADQVIRRPKLRDRRDRHQNKLDAKRKRKLHTKRFVTAQSLLRNARAMSSARRRFQKAGERARTRQRLRGAQVQSKPTAATPETATAAAPPQGIALVVRVKGKLIPADIRHAFARTGLDRLYRARLVAVTPRSRVVLQQLRSFALIGFPSMDLLDGLLRTRGAVWNRETHSKRLLSGNRVIEDALGPYGIFCIEDLVATLAAAPPNLSAILRHVAPFDFHPPHHLYLERHRGVHQRLEVANPLSFVKYLRQQLEVGDRAKRQTKRRRDGAAASEANAEGIAAEE